MSIKIASLFAELGIRDTLTPALQKSKTGLVDIKGGMVQAAAMAGILTTAYYAASKAIDATMGEFVKYANQVRTVNQLTGQTTEESSRLIQVLDDYKIGVDNINAATRTFIQNGETMSTGTLARLSDKYSSLTTVQEKNAFMLENFGRDYQKFLLIMEAGGDTIRKNADAVSKGLILDDKALKRAREYELALDSLNDTFVALKITIGSAVIKPLSELIKVVDGGIQAWGLLLDVIEGDIAWRDASHAAADIINTLNQLPETTEEAADGLNNLGRELYELDSEAYTTARSIEESFELSWTSATDKTGTSVDLMGDMLKGLGENGEMVWEGFMVATGKISPEAIEQFVRIQDAFNQAKAMLASGMSVDVVVQFLVGATTPSVAGGGGTSSGGGGGPGAGWVYKGTKNGPGTGSAWYNADLGQWHFNPSTDTGWAQGGSFVVPPGYPNDSYPLMPGHKVQSGERVDITPAGKTPPGGTSNFYITANDPAGVAYEVAHIMEVNRLMGMN